MSYTFTKAQDHWDDSCHKYPTPETRCIDRMLNDHKSPAWERVWEITDEMSMPIARGRQRAHETNGTPRFFLDKHVEENKGVKGELAFELMTGYLMDRKFYRHGDRMIDFRVMIGGKEYTLDVKTADTPKWLFVKEPDIDRCADYLVQAKCDGDRIWFIGWTIRKVMKTCPVVVSSKGISNYQLPANELQPMQRLIELLEPTKGTL